MNEWKYNNQAINEYLLGSLLEAEHERFDELSFTDEEFAAVLKSAEKDLVDAYVYDELTGETLEKFKSHYLASPLRREKVEFARAFQVFAERNVAETSENSAGQESKPKRTVAGFFSLMNVFKTPNSTLQWGFAAAALAFVVSGGWIVNNRFNRQENQTVKQEATAQSNQEAPKQIEKELLENSDAGREVAAANKENERLQQEPEKKQTKKQSFAEPARAPKQGNSSMPPKIGIASFIIAPPMRGGNQIPNLPIPQETGDVAIQMQLESDDYAAYRVALVNQAGKNLWRSGTIKPKNKGDNKILNLRFPAKLLKSQIYSLTASGINADGAVEIISNYPFRSVLK